MGIKPEAGSGLFKEAGVGVGDYTPDLSRTSLPPLSDALEIPRDSVLGARLTHINNIVHASYFQLPLDVQDGNGTQHLRAEAVDRASPYRIYGGHTPDAATLANTPLTVPVNELLHQDRIGFSAGSSMVNLDLDQKFKADQPLKALEAGNLQRNHRFIIVRDDPDYPKSPHSVRSAKFTGIKATEEGPELEFSLDSGNTFSVRADTIREIYRAGKEHTLIENGYRGTIDARGTSSEVIDFDSVPINDYFAKFQKVTVGYRPGEDRKVEQLTGTFLDISQVPTFKDRLPTGKHKNFLFLLTDEHYPQVHAIEASKVAFVSGHAGESSPVEGNSRSTTALGKLASYCQGEPIYTRPH